MNTCRYVPALAYGPLAALRKALAASFLAATLWAGSSFAPALAQPLELVALGDSLTQGYGLLPGEGLVPQLQGWLGAQGVDVRVVNAGVSGDTTAGGRARLGWSVSEYSNAVMIALGGNDMLRGLPPAQARENLAAMLAELQALEIPVLLVGLKAPGNYGAEYEAQFDAIWPELAAQYHALLLPDLLAPIAARTPQERAAQGLMQGDGIHPSAAGVKLVVEALGPKVLELLARAQAES